LTEFLLGETNVEAFFGTLAAFAAIWVVKVIIAAVQAFSNGRVQRRAQMQEANQICETVCVMMRATGNEKLADELMASFVKDAFSSKPPAQILAEMLAFREKVSSHLEAALDALEKQPLSDAGA
jgi:S-adenosylmethionine synthetase